MKGITDQIKLYGQATFLQCRALIVSGEGDLSGGTAKRRLFTPARNRDYNFALRKSGPTSALENVAIVVLKTAFLQ